MGNSLLASLDYQLDMKIYPTLSTFRKQKKTKCFLVVFWQALFAVNFNQAAH